MNDSKCLFCYKKIDGAEVDFHVSCSKAFFGTPVVPELTYTKEKEQEWAKGVINSQIAITGAQAKLSLGIEKNKTSATPNRFTIIGLWGQYILKPPTDLYRSLPEIEDTTMHLASLCGIATVPHSLIRLQSGALAYITKRIDRTKKGKLHMEDMCQLSERMTEHKYQGSYEQIAKKIMLYSANPALDVIRFFEQVVFSFLTGNADMHLKNFSLIDTPKIGYTLCPAYDMVATELVMGDLDKEELGLMLNGKKSKIKKKDFVQAMKTLKMTDRSIDNVFEKFEVALPSWFAFIEESFLDSDLKIKYRQLIEKKIKQLDLKLP